MKKENIKLIVSYTVCFIIMFLGILFMFNHYDKSFLYDYDGLGQHIITLKTFRDLLLEFFKTGTFNTYIFNIGLGMDFYANYAFYSFGDPLSYLSVFIKDNQLVTFYSIINVIRLYIVGLSFITYTKYKKLNKNFAILVGSLIYTFSTFNISEFTLQPFFMNAVILFPLLMIGIDKCILENKTKFLIFIEFIMFINHYYFAVLLSICALVYALIQTICSYYKDGFKKIIITLFKVGISMFLGILLSSFVLLPTASLFLDSGRKLNEIAFTYVPIHYQSILLSLITNVSSNEGYLGTMIIGVLLFFLSFKDFKKYKAYILFVLIMFIPLLIPRIGSLFSLGSYPLLRFSFVIPFMIAFISSSVLEQKITLKNIKIPAIALTSYLLILFLVMMLIKKIHTFPYFDMDILYMSLGIMLLGILLIVFNKKLNKLKIFELLTILLIITNGYVYTYTLYSNKYNDKQNLFVEKDVYKLLDTNNLNQENFKEAVNYLKENDKSIYRVSFDEGLNNIGLYYGVNTISAYYSILPSTLDALTYDMDSFKYQTNHMDNLDNRAKLLSLLNVKYYISDLANAPYGFKLYKEFDKTKIYINDNYLDYASFYTSYITLDEFNEYNSLEKEESLLSSVSLEENDINEEYVYYNKSDLSNIININHKITDNKIYTIKGFEVNNTDDSLTLNVNSLEKGDYYLLIEDIEFYEPLGYTEEGFKLLYKDNYEIKVTHEGKTIEKEIFGVRTMPYINHTKNYLLKLGYYEEFNGSIKIELPTLGKYRFKSMNVVVSKYDNLESKLFDLSSSNFKITEVKNNIIKGTAEPYQKGVLVFSTSYSDNYEVLVDGKKTNTFKANKYFLGINIDEGFHEIEIISKTPKKTLGLIVSFLTLIVLLLCNKLFKNKL